MNVLRLLICFNLAVVCLCVTESESESEIESQSEFESDFSIRNHHHQNQNQNQNHIRSYCQPTETWCWPSSSEIHTFQTSLSSGSRVLIWPGPGFPRVSAVPTGSPDNQPLYGLGAASGGLSALYEATAADSNNTCFEPSSAPYTSVFCFATTRSNEQLGWQPAFTVFVLNAADVQTSVNFAVKHDLCISVAGTGHDLLNRHSCPNGVFIRTTLLRDIIWPGQSTNDHSLVTFGSGIIFDEAHFAVSQKGRAIASAWSPTVGVAGWSLGGGHGPFNPGFGLGPDNVISVDIVLANGELVTANATSHSTLFRAIRGGGGSTWGVIVSFTVKTHPIPAGGFTKVTFLNTVSLCSAENLSAVTDFLDSYSRWALTLDSTGGGLLFSTTARTNDSNCPVRLSFIFNYIFHGAANNSNVVWMAGNFSKFFGRQPYITNFANSWEFSNSNPTEYLIPVNWLNFPTVNGIPSSFVSRTAVESGLFTAFHVDHILQCFVSPSQCRRWEIYQDLTGNTGSPHDHFNSLHPAFRNSLLLIHVGVHNNLQYWSEILSGYKGGATYFSESQYNWGNNSQWKTNYWYDHYHRLLEVKLKYDPHLHFYCRNCVASDLVNIQP